MQGWGIQQWHLYPRQKEPLSAAIHKWGKSFLLFSGAYMRSRGLQNWNQRVLWLQSVYCFHSCSDFLRLATSCDIRSFRIYYPDQKSSLGQNYENSLFRIHWGIKVWFLGPWKGQTCRESWQICRKANPSEDGRMVADLILRISNWKFGYFNFLFLKK